MAFWDDYNAKAQEQAVNGVDHSWDNYFKKKTIQDLAAKRAKDSQPKGNFLTSLIPTAGGTAGALGGAAAGAAAGSIVPGLGTAVGGLLGAIVGGAGGSALGKVGENAIEGQKDLGQGVGQEALMGGLTSIPITSGLKLARAGVKASTGFGSKAASTLVDEAGRGALPKMMNKGAQTTVGTASATKAGATNKVRDFIDDRAAANFLGITPAEAAKLANSGIKPAELGRIGAKYGNNAEDIIGATGKGGPLQADIKSLENQITAATKDLDARGLRISGDGLIKKLEIQRAKAAMKAGNEERVKALDKQIKLVKAKYKNGLSYSDARAILRDGNSKFGASVLDDTAGAVARDVEKAEANALRKELKQASPDIADALDTQSKLIQTRDILTKKRGTELAGKGSLGRIDVFRPGTLVDPFLRSNKVTGAILRKGGEVPPTRQATMSIDPVGSRPPGDGFPPVSPKNGGVGSNSGVYQGTQSGQSLIGALTRQSAGRLLTPDGQTQPQVDQLGLTPEDYQAYQDAVSAQGLDPTTTPFDAASGAPDASGGSQVSNPFGVGIDEVAQRMTQALAQGDSKGYAALSDLYDRIYKYEQDAASTGAGKPLSAEASKVISNAQSGLDSLNVLESAISSDPGILGRSAISGTVNPFGITGNLLGTGQFETAKQNVIDVIARLRTGAAITNDEAGRFAKLIPQPADNPAVVQQKLQMLRNQFQQVANRTGSAGTDASGLVAALGGAQ